MPRKGPSKKSGEACTTSLSFYPAQFRWLQLEKINRGLPSVAELIRSLVDRAMSEQENGGGDPRDEKFTMGGRRTAYGQTGSLSEDTPDLPIESAK